MVEGIDRAAIEEVGLVAVARETLCSAVLAIDIGFTIGLETRDGGHGTAVLGRDGHADVRSSRERLTSRVRVATNSEASLLRQREAGQDEGHEKQENRADAHGVLLCTCG